MKLFLHALSFTATSCPRPAETCCKTMASDCRRAVDQENPGRRSSDGISPSVGRIGERHKTVCSCRHEGRVSVAALGNGR